MATVGAEQLSDLHKDIEVIIAPSLLTEGKVYQKDQSLECISKMILILDFGSQYTELIARRIRELNVYSVEVLPHNAVANELKNKNYQGIILSGGPASVDDNDSPGIDKEIFNLNIPILGHMLWHAADCKRTGGNSSHI